MNFKRSAAVLMAAIMTAAPIAGSNLLPGAYPCLSSIAENAPGNPGARHFYDQLSEGAKVFYNAMEEMNTRGLLKTGTSDLDLTAEGFIPQEVAEAYADSGATVMVLFGAARDAFYYEHPDLFYVDFSSLSIRVTSGSDGYHIYLGTGRRDNYFAKGFTSQAQVEAAIAEYEAAVERIAAEANKVTASGDDSPTAAKVRFVHDYITHHTSYRLEDVCKPENIGLIRTSYGSLVRGEAVCEGYSRAFKAILDRLDIPCVLVSGIYRYTADSAELHMWTNVMVDGTWYGTDPTMDDPRTDKPSDNGVDGYECDELLLVGNTELDKHHAASHVLSEANFSFEYPVLSYDNYGESTVKIDNGLTVTYDPDGTLDGEKAGIYTVSYKGMGYAKAAEEGKYIVCNMSSYYENSDEWANSGWMYIAPEYFPAITDTDTDVTLPLPHVQYIQFGVTDLAPGVTDYEGYEIPDFFYNGDPELLLAASETYHNPSGYYVAPPYAKTSSPINGRSIDAGKKQHITITYNDTLIPVEGEEPHLSFTASSGSSGIKNSKLENFEWDGDKTISFDFTPSNMWADDRCEYCIQFEGVVGNRSHKAPYTYNLIARNDPAVCAYRSQGYYWNLFGQPTLMDNSDISTNGWETADGEPVADQLTDRMVLIATSPTHKQTDEMNEMIENNSDANVLSSQTYNIDLTICNKKVISTGSGVRVTLGFPEGYGPEDEGVTFKVYHFTRNASGALTGVEEIPCTITKYGLVVLCKSFSPYAVVAVEDDGSQKTAEKSVVISSTDGGTVSGTDSIASVPAGGSLPITLNAEDGYVIEAVSVDGKFVPITNSKTMKLTVKYTDLENQTSIIDVKFAAESVIEKEAERGEIAVFVDAEAAQPEKPVDSDPPVVTAPPTTSATTTTTTKPTTTSTTTTSKPTTTSTTTTTSKPTTTSTTTTTSKPTTTSTTTTSKPTTTSTTTTTSKPTTTSTTTTTSKPTTTSTTTTTSKSTTTSTTTTMTTTTSITTETTTAETTTTETAAETSATTESTTEATTAAETASATETTTTGTLPQTGTTGTRSITSVLAAIAAMGIGGTMMAVSARRKNEEN